MPVTYKIEEDSSETITASPCAYRFSPAAPFIGTSLLQGDLAANESSWARILTAQFQHA